MLRGRRSAACTSARIHRARSSPHPDPGIAPPLAHLESRHGLGAAQVQDPGHTAAASRNSPSAAHCRLIGVRHSSLNSLHGVPFFTAWICCSKNDGRPLMAGPNSRLMRSTKGAHGRAPHVRRSPWTGRRRTAGRAVDLGVPRFLAVEHEVGGHVDQSCRTPVGEVGQQLGADRVDFAHCRLAKAIAHAGHRCRMDHHVRIRIAEGIDHLVRVAQINASAGESEQLHARPHIPSDSRPIAPRSSRST